MASSGSTEWANQNMATPEKSVYRTVTSDGEKKALLGDDMVRFQPALGVSTIGWMETLKELLIELPTSWSVVNVLLLEEFAEFWIERHGEWKHGSGRTKSHNELGMSYAWWALHEASALNELHLSDSPDFSGSMLLPDGVHSSPTSARVCGDIGKCTPVALLAGLRTMNFHDVWISVADWQTQVLIEFGYSPSEYLSY